MHKLRNRTYLLILIDILAFTGVFWAAVIAANTSSSSVDRSFGGYASASVVLLAAIFALRFCFSVYNNVWRYANSQAYLFMVIADTLGGGVGTAVCYFVPSVYLGIWQSIAVVAAFSLVTLSLRFLYQQRYRHLNTTLETIHKVGVAIVGAGNTGARLAEDLLYTSKSRYKPICFIDVSQEKIGSKVCGVPVISEDDMVVAKLKTMPVQEIIIALPELDNAATRRLIDIYHETGCPIKIYDFPFKESTAEQDKSEKRQLREVRIEDLLFRDSLKIVSHETDEYYKDKVILVTGGGGSIGSELCRQIAKRSPKKLIIFDIYENNAYDIEQELRRKYGEDLDLAVEIGSVRDTKRLDSLFKYYRPQIVFHAAAHKHVPLMEHSGCEAVKNNVLGTYKTANAAEKYGVEKFILISTDKAVNPTNIMGATKRMCEMVIQCRTDSATSFAAVRFGNVLGSNGSVIPLFRRQIEAGGPITVTDKRIIRYFMTIPEASQLVMQAGAMAKSGELFVLDMGKPVKILELAENMIRLSGLTPYTDIDIVEIGLRPGEKLYEELLIKTEELTKTANNLIFVEHDTPKDRREMEIIIERLRDLCKTYDPVDSDEIRQVLQELVPTYHNPDEVNRIAEKTEEMQLSEK
ncbi:MAG: polysaccharide biosynthesis protein [Ruminococcaceae bacterium]|nr:polysaccharide biosynthesis protein [Oscillospiraceae bacterium]